MVSGNIFGGSTIRVDNACGNPALPGGVTFSHLADIPMSSSNAPPQARQPTGTLATNDARICFAIYYGGKIWDTFNDACSVNGTSTQASARLQEIDVPTLTLEQDMHIAS